MEPYVLSTPDLSTAVVENLMPIACDLYWPLLWDVLWGHVTLLAWMSEEGSLAELNLSLTNLQLHQRLKFYPVFPNGMIYDQFECLLVLRQYRKLETWALVIIKCHRLLGASTSCAAKRRKTPARIRMFPSELFYLSCFRMSWEEPELIRKLVLLM